MLLFSVKFDGRIFVKCDGHRIIGPKSRAIALQQHQGIPFLAKDTQVILQDVGAQKYKTVSLHVASFINVLITESWGLIYSWTENFERCRRPGTERRTDHFFD